MTITNIIFSNIAANKRVTIASKNVEYTMNNALGTPISIPSTDSTSTESTKIINLLKIVERFDINGYIITGLNPQGTSPIERTNAEDVKNDLISISKTRAVKGTTNTWTIMSYEGVDYYITFEKISIREDSADLGTEAPSGVIRYDVKISVVIGEPIV